jgi:hypothetical protein
MQKILLAATALFFGSIALAQAPATDAGANSPAPRKVCQYVVKAEPGATPEKMCLTKAEWDGKALADAKDANRLVCHYEQVPGTRFRSAKVCMPASQWAEQRRLEREAIEQIQRSTPRF